VGKLTDLEKPKDLYQSGPVSPPVSPPGTPNHVSFAKNRVSFRKNDPEFDRVYDRDMIPKDHVYLGAFGHTISPQISLPSLFRNPPKITQRKDARIRVLFKDSFCHGLQGVAKGIPK
jgi:hypothetical protein